MAWSDESLILYFYSELDAIEADKLEQELQQNETLRNRYQNLVEVLRVSQTEAIPEPSEMLNQNIMAAVHRSIDQHHLSADADNHNQKQNINKLQAFFHQFKWLNAISFAVIAVFSFSLFYLGRISVEQLPERMHADVENSNSQQQPNFSNSQSQRVLYQSLQQHLDSSNRLLTTVSNTESQEAASINQRMQYLDDLLAFNRLYRRLLEKNGDQQLAQVLRQMESILIEIKNADSSTDSEFSLNEQQLESVKQRLNHSDLIFKIRVSKQKIKQQTI